MYPRTTTICPLTHPLAYPTHTLTTRHQHFLLPVPPPAIPLEVDEEALLTLVPLLQPSQAKFGDQQTNTPSQKHLQVDEEALLTLVRLLKLSQPISKGQLQRLFQNLCANSQASQRRWA